MSSKKVKEKNQGTKKMVRFPMEVKKEVVEKYKCGVHFWDLAAT